MKINQPLSVFIPAYNEEKIIEKNIKKINNYLKEHFDTYELVIVDDYSNDKTLKLSKNLEKTIGVRNVHFDNGPSRRENLGKAMLTAKYDYIGFLDMDLATDITYLQTLFFLLEKYDIVLGSRYKGIKPHREWWRLLFSKIYNIFMRVYFNSKISDHQCGFKAFRKEVLLRLLKEVGYDKTFKRGWFWDAELLIRAQKHKLSYIEMPVKWTRGEKSTFNFKREIKMLGYVLKLKFRL